MSYAETIAGRVMKRYRSDGLEAAVAYLWVARQDQDEKILPLISSDVASEFRRLRAEHERLRAERELEAAPAMAARDAAEEASRKKRDEEAKAAEAALQAEYAEHTRQGTLTKFLAGCSPTDRDRLATKDQRRAAIDLRKGCVMSGKVRAALECSKTELDRWDGDGRLSHVFVKRIDGGWGRTQDCRLWDAAEVEHAKLLLGRWRALDEIERGGRYTLSSREC